MNNKYQHAINTLQSELMQLGGQCFTEEFRYRALQEKAKRGDMLAQAQLNRHNPFDTIQRLMDLNQPQNQLEHTFLRVAEAIEVLVETGEQEDLRVETGYLAG